jgi:hypothetical protein
VSWRGEACRQLDVDERVAVGRTFEQQFEDIPAFGGAGILNSCRPSDNVFGLVVGARDDRYGLADPDRDVRFDSTEFVPELLARIRVEKFAPVGDHLCQRQLVHLREQR